jgi:multiple sugar transport system permease protein
VTAIHETPEATAPDSPSATVSTRRRRAYRRDHNGPLFWVAIVLLALVFVVPILWMYLTSFRTEADARTIPVTFIPDELTLQAYRFVFFDSQNPVLLWALNSFIAATLHCILVLAVSSFAAYALARMQFRGKNLLFAVLVATLFLPGFVFLMPNYLLVDTLGWTDTIWALVVPGAAGAFSVFFLRQFFLSIPRELEETALIDGANQWVIFTRIILPLSKPALVTLTVLAFLSNWNDFIWPIFVLFSPERLTLAPGLATLQGAEATNYPVVMAGATIASIPVLILYIVLQRYIIEGVANSGIKG